MSNRVTFVVPPGVGWTSDRDPEGRPRVFVAPLPNGPVSVLPEVSALIWLTALEGSGSVVEDVADTSGHTTDTVREDVNVFLDELVRRGLLARE